MGPWEKSVVTEAATAPPFGEAPAASEIWTRRDLNPGVRLFATLFAVAANRVWRAVSAEAELETPDNTPLQSAFSGRLEGKNGQTAVLPEGQTGLTGWSQRKFRTPGNRRRTMSSDTESRLRTVE